MASVQAWLTVSFTNSRFLEANGLGGCAEISHPGFPRPAWGGDIITSTTLHFVIYILVYWYWYIGFGIFIFRIGIARFFHAGEILNKFFLYLAEALFESAREIETPNT